MIHVFGSLYLSLGLLSRACFKKLPKILCFNTMRYTFNMVTMMKEKVNTHFSFPLRLDMTPYMEDSLIQKERLQGGLTLFDVVLHFIVESHPPDDENDDDEEEEEPQEMEYELIGVTVHTGTADGGHYYSFIRDRMNKQPEMGQDKWFLFNDAEVKPFDPAQIASECFGGEMTVRKWSVIYVWFWRFYLFSEQDV
jgi:ubiquitin carboxyl-terminal hydrolase 34